MGSAIAGQGSAAGHWCAAGGVIVGARTQLVNLEGMTDDQLDTLQEEFQKLRRREERRAGSGRP